MSSITYEYRWTHPTTADVMGKLNVAHCDYCMSIGTRPQAWSSYPNSVEGKRQLDRIGTHILAEYPREEV